MGRRLGKNQVSTSVAVPATPPVLDSQSFVALRRRLLAWFARNQRDLPWRVDRDPYRIWVSEVMLQQTQVTTVIPFFERFLGAFPTLAELAAASEQDVLRHWEGLGYYRRARNLHAAARRVIDEHAGQFPRDPGQAAQLPGMGRYSVGAVLSQAFDTKIPIVEANSQRLLCRLFGQRDDPRRGAARRWLWKAAESLLPARQVGEFNQALMELGALVCTPTKPDCNSCPLANHCTAHRLGLQEAIPIRATAPETVYVREVAVVIRRGSSVLLAQRPDRGRCSSMWEFPRGELRKGEAHESAAERLIPELTGLNIDVRSELMTIRHAVTHHQIALVCLEAAFRSGRFSSEFYTRGQWLRPERLGDWPVSKPQRRLAQELLEP